MTDLTGAEVGIALPRLAGAPVFCAAAGAGTVVPMTHAFRELDSRSSDRIDVRLLWRQSDNRVIVTVADGKTGERFTVDVGAGMNANDVFHHPFAHA